jgi:hypothetical protein
MNPGTKQFRITNLVLRHLHKHGFSPQRKALVLAVFGPVVRWETGVPADELITLAQIVELSGNLELDTGESRRPKEQRVTVEELVENVRSHQGKR